MSLVELNGVNVSNLWVPPSNYPATCNGGYYLRSVGSFPWSHVEAM
jgi:serine protease